MSIASYIVHIQKASSYFFRSKVFGVVLVLIGVLILITPFTPGGLVFLVIGLTRLGILRHRKKKEAGKYDQGTEHQR